jgi:hypothetical protein
MESEIICQSILIGLNSMNLVEGEYIDYIVDGTVCSVPMVIKMVCYYVNVKQFAFIFLL